MKNLLTILFFLSSTSFADSISEPTLAWTKNELTVCWLDDQELNPSLFLKEQIKDIERTEINFKTADQKFKSIVQKSIQKEYQPEVTGISFIGWKPCDETQHWHVMIITGDGTETRGRTNVGMIHSKSFLFINIGDTGTSISNEKIIQYTAIHEFGHVAGLRHEHIRAEAKKDPLCKEYFEENKVKEKILKSTVYTGAYDPTSVMNYCFWYFIYRYGDHHEDRKIFSHLTDKKNVSRNYGGIRLKIGLSSGDVNALQCLYFPKEKLKEQQCVNTSGR